MTCKQWNVAVIPFPFVDTAKSKPRPVLIISHEDFISNNNHCIAAMITSSSHVKWSGDTMITDLESAGLRKSSIIRLKLFTLDMRLQPKVIGYLSSKDKSAFQSNFSSYIKV